MVTQVASPPRPRTAAPAAALTLSSLATLLTLMNYCAPAATLAATVTGLRAGPAAPVWVLSGISLGLAAALLPAGSLADNHGRKAVFVAGAAGLALSSVACAVAPDAVAFVAGRVVQGAASAALIVTSLGIVGHSFPAGAARVRATSIWGAMLGLGIALGPIASAALAAAGGWRLWYWATVITSALLAVAAAAFVPDSRAAVRRRPDVPGAVSLTAGVAALMAAVTLGRSGWTRPAVIALAVAAAGLLAAFCWIEARSRAPMLELRLLRERQFLVATGGALFTGLAIIGVMSYLSTPLEEALGLTPMGAALVMATWSGTSFLVSFQARRLGPVLSGAGQLALGLLLCAAGQFAVAALASAGSWGALVPGLLVSGAGSGLGNAALARLAVDSVPADRASMGSGANNTARYIGASLGVAMVVAVASHAIAAGGPAHPQAAVMDGLGQAMAVSAVLALVAAGLAFTGRRAA